MDLEKRKEGSFKNVLVATVKIVNFIKSQPLHIRLLNDLCDQMVGTYKVLLLYTEVHQLSQGKSVVRLLDITVLFIEYYFSLKELIDKQ